MSDVLICGPVREQPSISVWIVSTATVLRRHIILALGAGREALGHREALAGQVVVVEALLAFASPRTLRPQIVPVLKVCEALIVGCLLVRFGSPVGIQGVY